MKNKLLLALLGACVCFTACSSINVGEDSGDFELTLVEEAAGAGATDGKPTVVISSSQAEITLDDLLSTSELIVAGEVLDTLSEEHTNPDGTLKNYMGDPVIKAMATSYSFRIDEVYKGDAKPGDTIVVKVMNDKYLLPEEAAMYHVYSDEEDFYLEEGRTGIFCLLYADHYVSADAPEGEAGYVVVYQEDGIFEMDDSAVSNHYVNGQKGSVIYRSRSLAIDLNTFEQDIADADAWAEAIGGSDEGVFVDE